MKNAALILAVTLSMTGTMTTAQTHDMNAMADPAMAPLIAPMDKMMADIPMISTGKPDADFLLMMIPHHQSAIDMARVELEAGTDAATRAMAQAIIDAQEAEIAEMKEMLAAMGVEVPAE